MTQFYLVKVQRMCTSDECDLVTEWSAVFAEDDLPNLKLASVAELTALTLKDCPVEGIRPMTEDEIREWQENDE